MSSTFLSLETLTASSGLTFLQLPIFWMVASMMTSYKVWFLA